jgi:hypothetical protein
MDANRPQPRTAHVRSNTTTGPERFHVGGPDTTGLNETRSTAPTTERPLTDRAPTADAPVPRTAPRVHPDLMSKPEEVAFEDPTQGLGASAPRT